jgi:ascorbate-specific PTS system EIIC-type component UlaA
VEGMDTDMEVEVEVDGMNIIEERLSKWTELKDIYMTGNHT